MIGCKAVPEVGKIVGRIESALFLTSGGIKVIAESFIQLRDGKKYKDLMIPGTDGEMRHVSDLEEACELLFGKTYRTCLRIAQKYESPGRSCSSRPNGSACAGRTTRRCRPFRPMTRR